jgi:hypothetical protein
MGTSHPLEPKVAQRDSELTVAIPDIQTVADCITVQGAILGAVTAGLISTDQGVKLSNIVEGKRKAIETFDLEKRLTELEAKRGPK